MKRITFSGFLLLLGLAAASCGSENYSSNSPDMSLIPAKTGGKWGYIDRKGQFVIAPRFDRADVFYEGRAKVVSYANKKSTSGYIDQEGNAVTPVRFDYATGFSDGIAWVSTAEGAPTAIAPDGRELFTLRQAIWAHRYSEGLARVVEAHDDTLLHCTFYDTQGRKAIDLTGLAPANPDLAGFSCGRFPVMDSSGRCGYIDREGKLAVPCRFDMALPFESDGLAAVRTGGKWGTIDRNGKYRIAPRFSDIQAWGEIYAVRLDEEKWGYCDKEGNVLIEPQFAEAYPFVSGDLAAATADGKLWGYIDREGKWAIEPQFERADPFLGDIAPVRVEGRKHGFVGKDGRFVVEPQFEWLKVAYGGPVFYDAVRSNYFDAEGTAERIVRKLEGGRIEGLDLATLTAGQFQEKFIPGPLKRAIVAERNVETLPLPASGYCYTYRLGGNLLLPGNAGEQATPELDPQARPDYVAMRIRLDGLQTGKGRQLYDALRKRLGTERGSFGKNLQVALYGNPSEAVIYLSTRPIPAEQTGPTGFEETPSSPASAPAGK